MPAFTYTALTSTGQTVSGSLTVASKGEAFRQLETQGLTPVKVLQDEKAAAAQAKAPSPREAFGLAELYGRLTRDVWAELGRPGDIPAARRDLQREHVRLLAESVAKPSRRMPVDARSLQREFAQQLLRQLRTAAAQPGKAGHMETRAHLNESMAVLDGALKAQIAKVLN